MPNEWYVSFHGGAEKDSLNNIHVYSSDGREVRKALNTKSLAAGVTLRELRGFVFGPDRNLYVVNSYYEYSEVLKFKDALNRDGQHEFVDIFAKRDAASNPGLSHPFNAAFDSEGDLYVSSQDTSLISRYHGPTSKVGKSGTPMPLPSFIKDSNAMPPGTFVPSKNLSSNGVRVVREAIFGLDGNLYVADREANCVRKYQAHSGSYLGKLVSQSDGLDNPIHLLFSPDGRYLFIGLQGLFTFPRALGQRSVPRTGVFKFSTFYTQTAKKNIRALGRKQIKAQCLTSIRNSGLSFRSLINTWPCRVPPMSS